MPSRCGAPALAAVMVVLAGCGTYIDDMGDDPAGAVGRVEVTPPVLDFGDQAPGTELVLPLTVRNVGEGPLELGALVLDGPAVFALEQGMVDARIEPGTEVVVGVRYTAATPGPQSGTLVVRTDDPDFPHTDVALLADCAAAKIQIEPGDWDFGDEEVGCEQEQDLVLRNVGTSPLVLQDIEFTPSSLELSAGYSFPVGSILDPGAEETLTVSYRPQDEVPDSSTLHVHSNDGWAPDAVALQSGTAHYRPEVVEQFVQPPTDDVDILWMVDDTSSMDDIVADVVTTIETQWLDFLDVIGWEYHHELVLLDSEHALEYTTQLFSPPLYGPGSPLWGFLREGTPLRLMIVTDEDDQSSGDVADLVQALNGLDSNPNGVAIFAISGQTSGCDDGNHAALPAPRLEQAALMTGGETYSLCGDWMGDLLGSIWMPWFVDDDSYPLSEVPVVDTIEVEVDGVPLGASWSYDSGSNSIELPSWDLPPEGSLITVRYHPWGTCEG